LKRSNMKSRLIFIAAAAALSASLMTATSASAAYEVKVTPATVTGTVLGAVVLHALTIAATILGGGAGYKVATTLYDKKK